MLEFNTSTLTKPSALPWFFYIFSILYFAEISVCITLSTLSLLNWPKPAGRKHATIPEPAKTGPKKRHCLRLLSPPLIKNICSPNIFLLLLRYWPIILQLLRITKASLGRDRGMQILSSMTNKARKHGNSEKQFLLKKCENIVVHVRKPHSLLSTWSW